MKRLTLRRWLLAALSPAVLGLCAGAASAGPLFSDAYGVGAPDVLGSLADHDIRSLEVTELSPTKLQIRIQMSYHGGDTTLAPFAIPTASFSAQGVGVGDVLIQGQSFLWAIPLSGQAAGPGGIYLTYGVGGPVLTGTPATRSTALPGSLYKVTGYLTAAQVLGADPAADFRPDFPVWGAITEFIPTYSGFVPLVGSLGGGELAVQLQTNVGPEFYDDVINGYSIQFASTTCACDVLTATVPEPAPFALALGALAVFAARARLSFGRRGGARGSGLD